MCISSTAISGVVGGIPVPSHDEVVIGIVLDCGTDVLVDSFSKWGYIAWHVYTHNMGGGVNDLVCDVSCQGIRDFLFLSVHVRWLIYE